MKGGHERKGKDSEYERGKENVQNILDNGKTCDII